MESGFPVWSGGGRSCCCWCGLALVHPPTAILLRQGTWGWVGGCGVGPAVVGRVVPGVCVDSGFLVPDSRF